MKRTELKRKTPLRAGRPGPKKVDVRPRACCREHFEKVMLEQGIRCRAGQRLPCAACGRVYVHVCDEAGGCGWLPTGQRQPTKRTSLQRKVRVRMAGRRRVPDPDADPKYLAWVRLQDCVAADMGHPCRGEVHAHHPRHRVHGEGGGTAGRRCPDARAFPLCGEHHVGAGLHNLGGPFKGWGRERIRTWSDICSLTTRARYLVWLAGQSVDELASIDEPKREVLPS